MRISSGHPDPRIRGGGHGAIPAHHHAAGPQSRGRRRVNFPAVRRVGDHPFYQGPVRCLLQF
jgi:hypothetical protein